MKLILHIAFNQIVKIHSIAIEAPEGNIDEFYLFFSRFHPFVYRKWPENGQIIR